MGMATPIAGIDYSISTAGTISYSYQVEVPAFDYSKANRKRERLLRKLNHRGGIVGCALERNVRKQKRKLVRKARRLN